MSSRHAEDRLRVTVSAGLRLPGVTPRVLTALLGALAYLVLPPAPATLVLLLTIGAAVVPSFPSAWGAILVLALGQLGHPLLDPRISIALALAHLIHVAAALSAVADARGTVQIRVLLRALRRAAIIQLPAQVILIVVRALGGGIGPADAAPIAAIVAALAATAVVVLLVVFARRR